MGVLVFVRFLDFDDQSQPEPFKVDDANVDWPTFELMVKSLHGDDLTQQVDIRYWDEEDEVIISSQEELEEAFRVAEESRYLQLMVRVMESADNATQAVVDMEMPFKKQAHGESQQVVCPQAKIVEEPDAGTKTEYGNQSSRQESESDDGNPAEWGILKLLPSDGTPVPQKQSMIPGASSGANVIAIDIPECGLLLETENGQATETAEPAEIAETGEISSQSGRDAETGFWMQSKTGKDDSSTNAKGYSIWSKTETELKKSSPHGYLRDKPPAKINHACDTGGTLEEHTSPVTLSVLSYHIKRLEQNLEKKVKKWVSVELEAQDKNSMHPSSDKQVKTRKDKQGVKNDTKHKRAKPIHPDIFCGHCQMQIVGVRYLCGNCDDYDLCEVCEDIYPSVHNKAHVFIKLRKPCSNAGIRHGSRKHLLKRLLFKYKDFWKGEPKIGLDDLRKLGHPRPVDKADAGLTLGKLFSGDPSELFGHFKDAETKAEQAELPKQEKLIEDDAQDMNKTLDDFHIWKEDVDIKPFPLFKREIVAVDEMMLPSTPNNTPFGESPPSDSPILSPMSKSDKPNSYILCDLMEKVHENDQVDFNDVLRMEAFKQENLMCCTLVGTESKDEPVELDHEDWIRPALDDWTCVSEEDHDLQNEGTLEPENCGCKGFGDEHTMQTPSSTETIMDKEIKLSMPGTDGGENLGIPFVAPELQESYYDDFDELQPVEDVSDDDFFVVIPSCFDTSTPLDETCLAKLSQMEIKKEFGEDKHHKNASNFPAVGAKAEGSIVSVLNNKPSDVERLVMGQESCQTAGTSVEHSAEDNGNEMDERKPENVGDYVSPVSKEEDAGPQTSVSEETDLKQLPEDEVHPPLKDQVCSAGEQRCPSNHDETESQETVPGATAGVSSNTGMSSNTQLQNVIHNTLVSAGEGMQQIFKTGKDIFKSLQGHTEMYEIKKSTYQPPTPTAKAPKSTWTPSPPKYEPPKSNFQAPKSNYQLPQSTYRGPQLQVSAGVGASGEYAVPLRRIRAMGYFNNELSLALLKKYDGDVNKVVNELCEQYEDLGAFHH